MYISLYRAMRPEVFSSVIGQDHIVKILKHQIETGATSHAYLFCGTRGTGKTTMARLLAKAVNCTSEGEKPCGKCENCRAIQEGRFMDLIELDAASNNSVDDIREIVNSVNYPPATGRKKIYLIDEVHMLSSSAANALLKTLEEPPEYVIFILATTEPEKLLNTILSRCMRFDFKRVSEEELANHMENICKQQGIEITEGALRLLASNADGSVRDGLSLLEQCLAGGDRIVNREMVLEFLGVAPEEFFIQLTELILVRNGAEAIILLEDLLRDGKDVKQILKGWMDHYRALLLCKFVNNPEDMLNMSLENIERVREQCNRISLEEINRAIMIISETVNNARYSTQPRILMELAIVNLATAGFKTVPPPTMPRNVDMRNKGGTVSGGIPERKLPEAEKVTIEPKPEPKEESKKNLEPEPRPEAPPWDDLPQEYMEYSGDEYEEYQEYQEPIEEKKIDEPRKNEGKKTEGRLDELNKPSKLASIWQHVFDRAGADGKSLGLAYRSSKLCKITEREFRVSAGNEVVRVMLENERDLITSLMREEIGMGLFMNCRYGEFEDSPDDEENVSDEDRGKAIAKKIESTWNIDVKVENR